ncbi:hypothetical protein JZU68_02135 [bacterium]|nr:hypothetical protein [bacterium]
MKQKIGFDADKYIEEQSRYIIERINQGNSERRRRLRDGQMRIRANPSA